MRKLEDMVLELDFFFDKDDGKYKVVLYDDVTSNILKLKEIPKEQLNEMLNRETKYLMQEEY